MLRRGINFGLEVMPAKPSLPECFVRALTFTRAASNKSSVAVLAIRSGSSAQTLFRTGPRAGLLNSTNGTVFPVATSLCLDQAAKRKRGLPLARIPAACNSAVV